jgi:hypothetical protein
MFYALIGLGILCALAGLWFVLKPCIKATKSSKPEGWWRSIMSDAKFAAFHQAVDRYFADKGETLSWSDDKGMAVGASGAQMGMGNLAQICAKNDQAEWPKVIGEHFDRLAAAVAMSKPDNAPDYESIKDNLTIRLMPAEAVAESIRGESVWRSDLEGVVSMLAIDYPETVSTVNRSMAVEWGMPDEQLFATALHNLETKFKLSDPLSTELKNGPFFMFSAVHFFAASHALLIEKHPEVIGPYGAMVAIPTRHLLLACPVNTFDIVQDIGALLNVSYRAEADGPGSITNQIYFYRDGRFARLTTREQEGSDQLQLVPPPEFQRVLEELPPPKDVAS